MHLSVGRARQDRRVTSGHRLGVRAMLATANDHATTEAAAPERNGRVLTRALPYVRAVGVDAHVGTVERTDAS